MLARRFAHIPCLGLRGLLYNGPDGSLDAFLDGLTRRTVIDLARRRGIEVIERRMTEEDIAKASEVFICGTAAEVTPVGQIGEHHFQPGQMSHHLMDDYAAEVRKG